MQEIESEKDDAMRLACHRRAECVEVGKPARVLHHRLAVENRRFGAEFFRRPDQARMFSGSPLAGVGRRALGSGNTATSARPK